MSKKYEYNEWVYDVPWTEFDPLGKVKLKKLLDFLSTMAVVSDIENNKMTTANVFEAKERHRRSYQSALESNLKDASRVYIYYKKYVDEYEAFPIEDYASDAYSRIKKKNKPKKCKESKNTRKISNYYEHSSTIH